MGGVGAGCWVPKFHKLFSPFSQTLYLSTHFLVGTVWLVKPPSLGFHVAFGSKPLWSG